MKRNISFFLLIMLSTLGFAQSSSEMFETESTGSTSFTDNGVVFNIISHASTFDVQSFYSGTGWNGSSADNRYIDNATSEVAGASFSIKTTSSLFKVNRFWIYLSTNTFNQNVVGTLTITGKLNGVTKFTQTKSSGFATSLGATKGYTLIDLTSLNGQNYATTIIDELEITVGGAYTYAGLDAFTWQKIVGPTSSVVVANNNLSIGETSLVTITFSEAVSGFDNTDLAVANGTLSGVSSVDGGITWTATFTPSVGIIDATNFITLANTGVQNVGGIAGIGTTNSNNYAIDTQRPTASVVMVDATLGIGETTSVIITFNEAVTGFTLADLMVANGSLYGLSSTDGGITYTVNFTPAVNVTDATNNITLNKAGIQDVAGNNGSGTTNSNNYSLDAQRPTSTVVVADNNITIGETSLVTITFSEAVSVFTLADLTVSNGTLSSLSSADGGITWTATFTPAVATIANSNLITLYNSGIQDLAGNSGVGVTSSNNYQVNTALVVIASVTVPANAIYALGQNLDFVVNFSGNVNVTGTPKLGVIIGSTSVAASYVAGSGTASLSFSYTVQDGDFDSDGIALAPTLMLNGGTLKDASGVNVITDLFNVPVTTNVKVDALAPLIASIGHTAVSCNGGSNGVAYVNVSGGQGPYTYAWSPSGGTAATASGLSAATYTCTIRDANGSEIIKSVTINQPAILSVSGNKTDVLCNGSATGTASVSVSGGTGAYSYSWSPSGGTGATATGLAAGTYTVTIKDANLCQTTRSFTIGQPAVLTATTSQVNATCSTNGLAAVTVSGGSGSYTYSWSPSGGSSAFATGLTAGNYSVTVTDANGCTLTKTFTITSTNTLTATQSQTNILCNGVNAGTATVVPAGAPGPFTYVWSPSGGSAATATGLSAGNYSVTITATNGCSIVKNFTITQPNAITATTSKTDVTCSGGSNGTATVNPSGGTGAYTYVWAPSGGTGATASGLSAGTYVVTIKDANLCQTTKSIIITEPNAITAFTSQTNVTCNGGTDGTATVSPTGGTGSYTYSWAPFGGTGATASGLAAGTYTVTIKDGNLCQTTKTFTLTEPSAVSLTASTLNNAAVDVNYQQTIIASGASGSYTYSSTGGVLPPGITLAANGVLSGTPTAAGVYNFSIKATAQPCFSTATANFSITVAKGNQSIVFGTIATKTYGDVNFALGAVQSSVGLAINYTATDPTVVEITGNTARILNAGTTLITASQAGNTNYEPASVQQTLTIDKKALSITAATKTKVYGLIDPLLTYTSNGLVGSDMLSGALTRATGEHIGSYAIMQGTLAAGSNYILNYIGANLSITAKPVTITAHAKTKAYGDADPIFTYTAVGLTAGDVLSGGMGRASGETTGVYNIDQGTLSAGANYNLTFIASTLSIHTKALTITAHAKSKAYGGIDPTLTYTAAGLINGDSITGNLTRVVGENIGSYAITQGSLTAGANYTITYAGADLIITKKILTVIAEAKTKVYGNVDPSLTYTTTGLLVGDAITGSLSRTAGENAGIYAINQGALSAGANYTLNFQPSNLSITKKIIVINLTAKSKTYGEADPAFTYTFLPNLVAGDGFTGTLTRSLGENAGDYPIGQGSLTAGSNYTLNLQPSVFSINKASLNVTANNSQLCMESVFPVFTVSYSGFKNGDDQSSLSTKPTVTSSANNSATVGAYVLKPGGANATNYTFNYLDGILTINALPQVTISSPNGNNISKGETLILTASGGTSYTWANANGIVSGQNTAVLTVRPAETTTYVVTATNASGCSKQQSFSVEVRDDFQAVAATNFLSPNGDGINDNWVVNNIDMYPNNEVKVFDKAGRVIYSKRRYDNTWNGTINGVALAENTYYYIIDFGAGKLKQKGFITIVQQK